MPANPKSLPSQKKNMAVPCLVHSACPVPAAVLSFVRFFAILLLGFFIFAFWTPSFTFRLITHSLTSFFSVDHILHIPLSVQVRYATY